MEVPEVEGITTTTSTTTTSARHCNGLPRKTLYIHESIVSSALFSHPFSSALVSRYTQVSLGHTIPRPIRLSIVHDLSTFGSSQNYKKTSARSVRVTSTSPWNFVSPVHHSVPTPSSFGRRSRTGGTRSFRLVSARLGRQIGLTHGIFEAFQSRPTRETPDPGGIEQ